MGKSAPMLEGNLLNRHISNCASDLGLSTSLLRVPEKCGTLSCMFTDCAIEQDFAIAFFRGIDP